MHTLDSIMVDDKKNIMLTWWDNKAKTLKNHILKNCKSEKLDRLIQYTTHSEKWENHSRYMGDRLYCFINRK